MLMSLLGDNPSIMGLFLLCAVFILAWRYQATFKAMNEFRGVFGVAIACLFALFVGVLIGAYQVAGAATANWMAQEWSPYIGALAAFFLFPYIFLFLVVMFGAVTHGLYILATALPKKKKGIPQSEGAFEFNFDHLTIEERQAAYEQRGDIQRQFIEQLKGGHYEVPN